MKGAKILIVDDSKLNIKILKDYLKPQGYNVSFALDGAQAFKKIKTFNPDLLILDIVMPVMNGYDVLRKLNQDEAIFNLPVIIISALDHIENIAQCIKMGASDYLIKPYNSVLLNARIENCLKLKVRIDKEQAIYSRLVRSYESLRTFDELKSIEIKSIIRDFNSPLKDIKGYTKRIKIKNKSLSSDLKEIDYLKKIGEAVLDMESLFESLIDISKFEMKSMKCKNTTFDAMVLARDVYQAFLLLKDETKKCSFKYNELSMKVKTDRVLLFKILRNLLINADRHTPDHSRITFNIKSKNDKVIFEITDNGYGIPKEYHERIFDKYFFLGNNKINKKSYGIGLGLYFCKMAVEALGGKISVKGGSMKGSKFIVELKA